MRLTVQKIGPQRLLAGTRVPPGRHNPLTAVPLFRVLAALILVVAGLPAYAQEVPFTLEQVMGAPFPTDLTGAGDSFAWVINEQGVRNIHVATAPDYATRQVTDYTDDDGQTLGSLTFNVRGDTLVYVRGGTPNRQGEIPNPTSQPHGAERSIWRVAHDAPVELARGSSPAVHSGTVAFLHEGDVYATRLSGGAEPEKLFSARGAIGSLRFSPDGSYLAFVSQRGTHSFVGVYDRRAGTLRYMAPSTDRDSNPVWSPDGTRLAFLRLPADSRQRLFRPVMEGDPWSILVADVPSGTARTIWRADEGLGSVFRGASASNQLLWGANDLIIFPWEKEGWTHLYSISAAGGAALQLSSGRFEVEQVTLSGDRKSVIYSSNRDDAHRRHLWRVSPAGGTHQALTPGDGIEWSPVTNARDVAFIGAGAREPARVYRLDQERLPLMPPPAFPAASLVVPTSVDVTAADGLVVPAQLFLPPDISPGERRPAIIYFHGGSRRQMLLGWHYSGYYNKAYAMNQYMAALGFVVLSVNYRSGIGYGTHFREAPNYGSSGGSEFFDVLGAGLYLKSRPDVAPDRIGLWGGSYGGYLTALGLARASNLFAAGVDIHGVHDWNLGIQNFDPSYNPLAVPEDARTAFEASPMAHVDSWRSPVLVIHGDDDRNVAFKETVLLVEALRERDVHVEQLVFPDEVHGFLTHRRWMEAYGAAADFFLRMLREPQ